MKEIINLKNIAKTYKGNNDVPSQNVLTGVDLILEAGDTAAIIGPSGSGKTTLLNIIGALDKPTSGIVEFDNVNINTYSEKEMSLLRNRSIGFVFQQHHLLPQCTALENVLLPTLVNTNRKQRNEAAQRAKELLARVGMADKENKRPAQLSGGECQRVAVVRALINNPKLLLADEPTGSLDRETAFELYKLLSNLNSEYNETLIVLTHSQELANEMKFKFKLNNGKLNQLL